MPPLTPHLLPACYKHLVEAMGHHGDRIETLENTHKLIELQRDLVGIDSIQLPNRVNEWDVDRGRQ